MSADERRVEVAAEALAERWGWMGVELLDKPESPATMFARVVVAALDAHDGDLRERLAGAVEALKFTAPSAPLIDSFDHGIETAVRIIRERP